MQRTCTASQLSQLGATRWKLPMDDRPLQRRPKALPSSRTCSHAQSRGEYTGSHRMDREAEAHPRAKRLKENEILTLFLNIGAVWGNAILGTHTKEFCRLVDGL